MPPTKKPPTRSTRGPLSNSGISRKEVERATARFEKALDEALAAVQAIGQDLGKGGRSAYREIDRTLKALRREAGKTNRAVLKDVDQLKAAVATGRQADRATGGTRSGTGARSSATRSARSSPAQPTRSPTRAGGARTSRGGATTSGGGAQTSPRARSASGRSARSTSDGGGSGGAS